MSKTPMYADRRAIARCLWCKKPLVDGADVSGFAKGPDYMTKDGDFGCWESPDTNEDGSGSHTPDVVTTWDGHAVRVSPRNVVRHQHGR